ncbi:MAG: hypothetical protein LBJ44_07255 [Propionibacteriaceae bacterium]|nr:hypothetical protein [Propionibacteriaceae bacterium]
MVTSTGGGQAPILDRVCRAIRAVRMRGTRQQLHRQVFEADWFETGELVGVDHWAVLDQATERGLSEGWLRDADFGEPFFFPAGG